MSVTSERAPRQLGYLVINALFVLAFACVGAVAAWPIYESAAFIVLVIVGTAAAGLLAAVSLVRGWSWFLTTIIAIATYLVIGAPLSIPGAVASPATLPSSWLQFVSATVLGWKQLITVTIPVGTYQALLAPALLIFFATTLIALCLSWRTKSLYVVAVPLLILPALFGVAFGADTAIDGPALFWFDIGLREFLIGLLSLIVSLAFLGWRARRTRAQALRLGTVAVIRQLPGSRWGAVRRGALSLVMVLVAVAVAGAVVPGLDNNDRHVLRSVVAPEININEYVSPLTQYRSYFGGSTFDSELFSVDGDRAALGRLRIAVLSYYDGTVFRVVDPRAVDASRSTAFARIPSRLHPEGENSEETAEITVGGYSGVWVPTVGALTSLEFSGHRSDALENAFFYNASSAAGVELATLRAGDVYRVAGVPSADIALGSLDTPSAPSGLIVDELFPENLVTWVRMQGLGSDANALGDLIERLRARGYLSHSLIEPVGDDAKWVAELGPDYTFEPSLSGHSIDRIDALFAALILKQNDTESSDDADLVAAVGDDEQFAVAAALLAQYLGFPARIVLGFDLDSSGCQAGSCRGADLAAWLEVQGDDGRWATVDVTPQHENAISPLNDQQRDPQNLTDVVPETATEQQPPRANPSGGDQTDENLGDDGVDLAWLANGLAVFGVALLGALVLLAPFLTVVVAKARRRRWRLKAPRLEARIVGGWDEYVDAALDYGKPIPSSETRTEVAGLYGTPRALQLAAIADAAVFDADVPDDGTAEAFWAIVEAERRSLAVGLSRWQRLRATVSLRSFTSYLTVRPPSADERRSR